MRLPKQKARHMGGLVVRRALLKGIFVNYRKQLKITIL